MYASEELLKPLSAIWLASDQMCSKRLKVALREWLPHYEEEQVEDLWKTSCFPQARPQP